MSTTTRRRGRDGFRSMRDMTGIITVDELGVIGALAAGSLMHLRKPEHSSAVHMPYPYLDTLRRTEAMCHSCKYSHRIYSL